MANWSIKILKHTALQMNFDLKYDIQPTLVFKFHTKTFGTHCRAAVKHFPATPFTFDSGPLSIKGFRS